MVGINGAETAGPLKRIRKFTRKLRFHPQPGSKQPLLFFRKEPFGNLLYDQGGVAADSVVDDEIDLEFVLLGLVHDFGRVLDHLRIQHARGHSVEVVLTRCSTPHALCGSSCPARSIRHTGRWLSRSECFGGAHGIENFCPAFSGLRHTIYFITGRERGQRAYRRLTTIRRKRQGKEHGAGSGN
jgi:hypothetical protein